MDTRPTPRRRSSAKRRRRLRRRRRRQRQRRRSRRGHRQKGPQPTTSRNRGAITRRWLVENQSICHVSFWEGAFFFLQDMGVQKDINDHIEGKYGVVLACSQSRLDRWGVFAACGVCGRGHDIHLHFLSTYSCIFGFGRSGCWILIVCYAHLLDCTSLMCAEGNIFFSSGGCHVIFSPWGAIFFFGSCLP